MRLVTTSQPQLFPPLYMVSRFLRADAVVWLSQAQHQSGQFMSDLQLADGKRTVGFSVRLSKPSPRPLVSDVRVEDPHLPLRLIDLLTRQYRNSEYLGQAVGLVADTLRADNTLTGTVIPSTEALLRALSPATPEFFRDSDLLPSRPECPSEWLASLTRKVGGTAYFQGRTAMSSYLRPDCFDGISLFSQEFECGSPKLSVLHYVATIGLQATIDLCASHPTQLEVFHEDSV